MRALVQESRLSDPISSSSHAVSFWFKYRGYDVINFNSTELDCGDLDKYLIDDPDNTVLFGGCGTVHRALRRCGREPPVNVDVPECLRPYADRRMHTTTMGEFRRYVQSPEYEPCHMKPAVSQKLFTGLVVREFKDLLSSVHVDADEPVLCSELVNFTSEWRATILRGRILNVAHYKGDPLTFPNPVLMQQALNEYVDRPVGFAMDWGMISTTWCPRTRLIECNDGHSLGNYGCNGGDYTAMIEARWRQMMGLPDNGIGLCNLPD